jgi:hypothetical protein
MARFNLDFSHRPSMRLSRVLEVLEQLKVIDPVPTRQTLIRWIEAGKIDGKKLDGGYVVYEDSLREWIKSVQPEAFAEIAPGS